MTISPEVAAVLREALQAAEYARCQGDHHSAHIHLTEAIEDPLAYDPAAEFAAHVAKHRRPADEQGPAF